MNDTEHKVTGLKKVTLSFEAGTTARDMDLTAGPQSYDLVVGIGTGGFTPFEYALLGKKRGDIIQLEVHTRGMGEMFGHSGIPLPASARNLESFFLNVKVDQIDEVDQAELVRAMAGTVSGCGGDCCGNH